MTDQEINQLLAKNVYIIRQKMHLSQEAMAEKLGIYKKTLCRLEQCDITPRMRIQIICKIHRRLGIEPPVLFSPMQK